MTTIAYEIGSTYMDIIWNRVPKPPKNVTDTMLPCPFLISVSLTFLLNACKIKFTNVRARPLNKEAWRKLTLLVRESTFVKKTSRAKDV